MKKEQSLTAHKLKSAVKLPLALKIVIVFTLFVSFRAQATVAYAQETRIEISMTNSTIEQVLNALEKKTDYVFLYNDKTINTDRIVSVKSQNENIEQILDEVFRGTDVNYTIVDKQIILSSGKNVATQESAFPLKGTIRNESGETLVGVVVRVKDENRGTITDIDGNFQLEVKAGDLVQFSYIGYTNQEIVVKDDKTLQIVMQESRVEVGGVVVTALGIKRESKSLSYNVQQIQGNEVTKVSSANFVNNLNGKIAGVTINSSSTGAGGSSRVVMRGAKSISGNNNALYVIDGIPMPNLSTEQADDIFAGAGQSGDGVSNINPDDIESISVLSGPSAAALYGSAAANGVVLITTKKGKQEKLSLVVSNSTMFSAPLILPEFQNTYGQSEQGSYYSWGDKLSTPSSYNPADFFKTGVNVSNSVSLSTGTERNQTYLSIGNVSSGGVIDNNDYNRYNLTVRNTSKFLNDKMTLDLGFMTSSVKEQNMISQGLYFNPLVPVYLFPPGDDFEKVKSYERYDAARNFKTQWWSYGDQGLSMQNPYWIMNRNMFINNKNRTMTSASLKYEFADWINLSGRAKIDQSNDKYEKKYNASTSTLFASNAGYYSLNDAATQQIYAEALLNINKYFADETFNLTANIGANIEDVQYEQNMYGGKLQGVPNVFTYSNVNKTTSESSQSGYRKQKQAVFASAQLGYKSMLYLDVTARNDWASTLAGASQSSFFYPTVGLSGIITDMFNIKTSIMPYMKARISYSEVGNEPDPFLTIATYQIAGGYPVTQTRMPNTDLQPERTKSWEAGLNFMFFNSKLKLDATAYQSSTYNQFFEPTLSSSSGYSSVIVNAGRVDNKGLELMLSYGDKFGQVEWESALTYSLNRNEIIELLPSWKNPVTGEEISLTEIDMAGMGMYKMTLKEGGSIGDIYVNTLRTDEHGAIYVHPSDQTVVATTNDFVFAGNSSPKYNLGWSNTFRWNGLSLGCLFTARVGGVVVSNTQAMMDAFGVSKASADAREAGGAVVNGRLIPAKEYYQTIGGAGGTSGIGSMYTYSATNVRLGELSVGYDIPVQLWTNAIKGLNVSFIGRNLFFLYNKAPYDPELTANTGTYYQGIDNFMMPSLRSMGFSVKVQF